MKGMPGGMQQMMKQFNQMQNKLKKVQEDLSKQEFEGSSGGNAVVVRVNGDNLLTDIKISQDIIKANDLDMLHDLILTATNSAISNAKEVNAKEMQKLTGGISLPGLF